MISCRKCGHVCKQGNKGLCPACSTTERAHGHGSTEYRANSEFVRHVIKDFLAAGNTITCGICHQTLKHEDKISIDHVTKLRDGGTHQPDNLRPVHASCNSRDH